MDLFLGLSIGLSVFSIGVTIIDLAGIFGDHGQDHGSISIGGHHGETGHDSLNDSHAIENSLDHNMVSHNPSFEEKDSTAIPENFQKDKYTNKEPVNYIVKILLVLRTFVYFSLGFGPVGIITYLYTKNSFISFLLSFASGIVIACMGLFVRKIQNKKLDSQLENDDFIMASAEITVKIEKGKIGKARIYFDGFFTDRFAKADNVADAFSAGTKVRITKATDDIVYVVNEKKLEE